MQSIDLTNDHKPLYSVCLKDWSEEIQEAGNHTLTRITAAMPEET